MEIVFYFLNVFFYLDHKYFLTIHTESPRWRDLAWIRRHLCVHVSDSIIDHGQQPMKIHTEVTLLCKVLCIPNLYLNIFIFYLTWSYRATMKSLVILFPVLSLTWIFGILYFGFQDLVLEYFHGIFSSLQVCLNFTISNTKLYF